MTRINIDMDDSLLEVAMRSGPFKTKKETVEAGLKLIARQAAYRETLKREGEKPGSRSTAAAKKGCHDRR